MVLKPRFLFPSPRSQATLTQVLQIQDQLWSSLSNPSAAMQELAGENFPVPMESPERGGGGSTEVWVWVWEVVETGEERTEGL